MLQGKIVVITGASSGIGAEMAVLLAKYGAVPVLIGRSLSKLKQVVNRINSEHSIYEMDVTSNEQVSETISEILKRYGQVDILINNAGFAVFGTLENASLEQFEQMMDVNYMGLVRCTKAILPSMLQRGSGHIINIGSIAGKMGLAKSSAYVATKHAVLGFTNSLRQDLFGTNIYVSVLNPGPIHTPFFETADPSGNYLKSLPKWYILKPEQVAKAVLDIIVHKRSERTIPRMAGIGVKLLNLFPGSLERLVYKLTNKK
jgi:short-subunit dehydrogenase